MSDTPEWMTHLTAQDRLAFARGLLSDIEEFLNQMHARLEIARAELLGSDDPDLSDIRVVEAESEIYNKLASIVAVHVMLLHARSES